MIKNGLDAAVAGWYISQFSGKDTRPLFKLLDDFIQT